MDIPSIEFLKEVEKLFSVSYPETFKAFCLKSQASYDLKLRGYFICDLDTLISINTKIGEGTWADYERAISGKEYPKNGLKLWSELLPIFVWDEDIFGFPYLEEGNDKVNVWSVHTIVHTYQSFEGWLKELMNQQI